MSELVVRRIRGDEWRHLKDVRLRALLNSPESFGSSYERDSGFADAVWMERAAHGEGTGTGATWIAEKSADSRFLAMITLINPDPSQDVLELVGMWVDPAERGTGLADELVTNAIDHARVTGCAHLRLWVATPNVRAQRLYLRHGFQLTGEVDVLPSNPLIQELRMAVTFAGKE
jgi:RimJ/RimL family protein N-acetyltransferase